MKTPKIGGSTKSGERGSRRRALQQGNDAGRDKSEATALTEASSAVHKSERTGLAPAPARTVSRGQPAESTASSLHTPTTPASERTEPAPTARANLSVGEPAESTSTPVTLTIRAKSERTDPVSKPMHTFGSGGPAESTPFTFNTPGPVKSEHIDSIPMPPTTSSISEPANAASSSPTTSVVSADKPGVDYREHLLADVPESELIELAARSEWRARIFEQVILAYRQGVRSGSIKISYTNSDKETIHNLVAATTAGSQIPEDILKSVRGRMFAYICKELKERDNYIANILSQVGICKTDPASRRAFYQILCHETVHACRVSTVSKSATKSEWKDLTADDFILLRDTSAPLRPKVCLDLHLTPEITQRALVNFDKYDAAVQEFKRTLHTHKVAGLMVIAAQACYSIGVPGLTASTAFDIYGPHAYKADGWLTAAWRKFDLACEDLEECPAI